MNNEQPTILDGTWKKPTAEEMQISWPRTISSYLNYDYNRQYRTIIYANKTGDVQIVISRFGMMVMKNGIFTGTLDNQTKIDDITDSKKLIFHGHTLKDGYIGPTPLVFEYDEVFRT